MAEVSNLLRKKSHFLIFSEKNFCKSCCTKFYTVCTDLYTCISGELLYFFSWYQWFYTNNIYTDLYILFISQYNRLVKYYFLYKSIIWSTECKYIFHESMENIFSLSLKLPSFTPITVVHHFIDSVYFQYEHRANICT